MRVHAVEQGTDEWRKLRMGIPTSSAFERILTAGGKPSIQARAYAFQLIAEKMLGRPLDDFGGTYWMQRGTELEPEAARAYEFQQQVDTQKVGFITNDAGTIGCSPDRLVLGHPGALEVKCYSPQNHIAVAVDGFGDKHIPQVQGQLLIGEFEWVDRWAYHPDMPPVRVRTFRDEDYIAKLAEALEKFQEMMARMEDKLRADGFLEALP